MKCMLCHMEAKISLLVLSFFFFKTMSMIVVAVTFFHSETARFQ